MRIVLSKIAVSCCALVCAGCAYTTQEESIVGDYLSGRLAASANDVNAAADAFASAQAGVPGAAEILRDAFFFQLASGDYDAAFRLAGKIAHDPESGDDGLARVVLAAQSIKYERYQSARDIVSTGVDANYLAATVKIIDAWATTGLEGPEAGIALLANAPANEFRGFNPLHMALMADKAGRKDDALAAHQLSVMTFGGTVGRAAYGAFLERSGDAAAAREYYELLTHDAGPDRQAALQGIARIDAGKTSRAYADATPAQGAAIAYYTLGGAILQEAANQRAAAERAGFNVGDANYNLPLALAQVALYLDPSLDDARRFAGSILNAYGDHEKAVAMLEGIAPSSPYYELSRIEIAGALAALDKDNEAIAVLRGVARRNAGALEARLTLGNLLAVRGRHEDAVKAFDDLIARLPSDIDDDAWRYYVARAASLLELGDWSRAEADLERAVEIAPEEATTLNYLGYSWAERGVNLDKAFEMIEKAVSLQPDSGAIIDSLGWAHYQLGDFETAVGHLEQAASLEPGDPTVTEHLGDVYWRLGRRIEARYQWRRALELEPSDEQMKTIEVKLADGLPDAEK